VGHNSQVKDRDFYKKGDFGKYPRSLFIKWYQSRERISCEKEEECMQKGKEVQLCLSWRVYGLTVVQMVAAEGEKICSNLEQGVLNWFQRREPEGCQKTE